MYVDDIVAGVEDDAFQLYIESKEVLSHGTLNLRKFCRTPLNYTIRSM